MRMFSIACIMGVSYSIPASGQHFETYQATLSPSQTRFEILQLGWSRTSTFRLDRFTGRIDQLVESWNKGYAWQEMEVPDRPEPSVPSRPRFQLLTSSSDMSARHTFLLDTDSGKTWVLEFAEGRNSRGGFSEVWTPLP